MYIVPFEKEPSVTAFVPFSVVQWSKYSIIKITFVIIYEVKNGDDTFLYAFVFICCGLHILLLFN